MSAFSDQIRRSKQPLDTCVRFTLLWVAHSDGSISNDELELIRQHLPEREDTFPIVDLGRIVTDGELADQWVVFETLRKSLNQDQRELLISLSAGIVASDERVAYSEVHALRFLADLLQLSPQRLNAVYREASGKDLPAVKDLSDPEYWEQVDQRARERQREQTNNQNQETNFQGRSSTYGSAYSSGTSSSSGFDSKFIEALATLGLMPGATQEEIKTAYRRLAAVHHPDRFTSLGQSATDAATKTFQRVKLAYDYLLKSMA